jgi:hypothetical protein
MTKDEYDLIEDFIIYYGHIFGYNNIIIIDNMSTNSVVLDVYTKYISKGITVYKEESYRGDDQGRAFTKYMNMYKDKAEFLIGLDTDEFMFSVDKLKNNNECTDKNDIITILKNMPEDITCIVFNSYVYCIPDPTYKNYINGKNQRPAQDIIHFFKHHANAINSPPVIKCLYRSSAFIGTYNGNHNGIVSYGRRDFINIGLFHFHSTGQYRVYERCKNVINGYNYFNTDSSIKEQIDILCNNRYCYGYHRVDQYYKFIMRKNILELFILYIKRLPTNNELNIHVNDKINRRMSYDTIFNEFSHCTEANNNINKDIPDISEIEKSNIIYYDNPLEIEAGNYGFIKNTDLSNKLELLYTL